MSDVITGGCLCGAVKYETKNAFDRVFLCHCKQCQKMTGSSFASNGFIDASCLDWTQGEGSLMRFDYPGRSIAKAFCSKCGSALPHLSGDGKRYVVPLGSLNGEPVYEDADRIFADEISEWSKRADEMPAHSGFPK